MNIRLQALLFKLGSLKAFALYTEVSSTTAQIKSHKCTDHLYFRLFYCFLLIVSTFFFFFFWHGLVGDIGGRGAVGPDDPGPTLMILFQP